MDTNVEFERRISEIHGLDRQETERGRDGGVDVSIRQQEFRAMTETFLGPNYDQEKLQKVEFLQEELHEMDSALFRKYESGRIDAALYVDLLNVFADWCFSKCERVLGDRDFEELFGAPFSERLWQLDQKAFAEAHPHAHPYAHSH
jgi:hypothetical protein